MYAILMGMIACLLELAMEMLEKPESGKWTIISKPNSGVVWGSLGDARAMYVAMLWYGQVNLVSLQKLIVGSLPCWSAPQQEGKLLGMPLSIAESWA